MDPAEEESPEARGGKIGYILLCFWASLRTAAPSSMREYSLWNPISLPWTGPRLGRPVLASRTDVTTEPK